jgi:hypothetical protein
MVPLGSRCDATKRCNKPAAWVVWRVGARIQDFEFICADRARAWLKKEPPDPKVIGKLQRVS